MLLAEPEEVIRLASPLAEHCALDLVIGFLRDVALKPENDGPGLCGGDGEVHHLPCLFPQIDLGRGTGSRVD